MTFDEYLSYDLNGNITNLKRYWGDDSPTGTFPADELEYTYFTGSNRLKNVSDSTNSSIGFDDGNTNPALDDYAYDENGNMIKDRNKGITNIVYNHLNLPVQIVWAANKKIEYLYNAAGGKVQKKVTNGANIRTTDYLDGFQYNQQLLEFFPHPEGYVKATALSESPANPQYAFNYVYNYTDHLGNVRVSYTKDPQTGNLKILDESHYYPFGLKHSEYAKYGLIEQNLEVVIAPVTDNPFKYKYQGQELQDELGLNWYSFKWRNYDPAIGRFMSIDPLSEKYVDWGPYVFSGNRVVDARELEGLEPALLKILTKYAKKGYNYVAKTVKGDYKPISREHAITKLQNKETVYSTGSAKDAKNLMKQSTDKKVVRHDGHDLPNGKKGMDHYQKKSGDGSHVNYGVDKSVAPVAVASTSEESATVETKTEEKSTLEKVGDFGSNFLESIGDFLGEFLLDGGIPLLAPTPLGGGEQQWIENKNRREFEQILQNQNEKQKEEEK